MSFSALVSVGEVDLALAQTVVLGAGTRAGARVGCAHATRARLSRRALVLSRRSSAVTVKSWLSTARAAGLGSADTVAVVSLSTADHFLCL
jgi:hypothetical protein